MIATFDTNILVYAADRRNPTRRSKAVEVLRRHEEALLLWQVACEFIAASRKLADHGLTRAEAWDQLAFYIDAYQLTVPGPAVFTRARILHIDQHWSFWDAMVVAACLEAGVERVYSEDLPGRAPPPGLEIINPFES